MHKIKEILMKWAKQPVIQFMFIGLFMFLVNVYFIQAQNNDNKEDYNIYISEGEVQSMKDVWESRWLRPPTKVELQGVINQRVEEAILFNEAVKIGLNTNDDIIRQRLSQKLEFLSNNISKPDTASVAEIEKYYKNNIKKYTLPETITIVQLFVNPQLYGNDLDKEIQKRLQQLKNRKPSNTNFSKYSDAFPLQAYFPEKSKVELAKLFGVDFTIEAFEAKTGAWVGPIKSQYGSHIIFVSYKTPEKIQELSTILNLVFDDLQIEQHQKRNKQYIDGILDRYTVIIENKETPSNK
jgi:hypothetical protein